MDGCLEDAECCLFVLVGIIGIFFGIGFGIYKVIETLIA